MRPELVCVVRDYEARYVPKGDYPVYRTAYHLGGTALMLTSPETGEIEGMLSVFLEGNPPQSDDHVWVKTWGENEGMLEGMIEKGVLERTGRTARAGFAEAVECRILKENGGDR